MPKTKMTHKRFANVTMLLSVLLVCSHEVAQAKTESFDKQMQPLLEAYLKIPKVLAADHTEGVVESAKKVGNLAKSLDPSTVTGKHAGHYRDIPKKLMAAARKLEMSKDIDAMREALKELSKPMAMWATMSKPKGVSVMYCSMAPGSWLQQGTVIANPYYGAKMLRCGEIVSGTMQ